MLFGALEDWKSGADIASSVVTSLAVLVGGGWAYWRFFRERTRWPRADVKLLFDERRLDERLVLLNVKVRVTNTGKGLMQLTRLRVDLRRVLPLGTGVRQKIQAEEQFDISGVKARWPLIKKHERAWARGKAELEPGETDDFEFDFFLEPVTKTVLIYTFLENVAKRGGNRKLGWGERQLHDIATDISDGSWPAPVPESALEQSAGPHEEEEEEDEIDLAADALAIAARPDATDQHP